MVAADHPGCAERLAAFQRLSGQPWHCAGMLAGRLRKLVERGLLEQRPALDSSAYMDDVLTERGGAALWAGRAAFPAGGQTRWPAFSPADAV
jgi:hypothetical protein